MSLLLDALKKAEKAKDDAKRRAQPGADADDTVMQVRTRNELPDISKPLEIHSEDIPGGIQLVIESDPVPDPSPVAPVTPPERDTFAPPSRASESAAAEPSRRQQSARAEEAAPDPQASQRATAKNVFEAKFREPNPKLPFYITMGFLGVFALGTVVYFWYQLRPPAPLVNTGAKPPADEKKADVVQPSPVLAAPAGQISTPSATGIPGMPTQPAPIGATASAPPPAPTPSPAAGASSAVPKQAGGAAPAGAAPASTAPASTAPAVRRAAAREARSQSDTSKLNVTRAAPEVNPKLDAAWLAYNQGNLAVARANYQDILREEPANRDSLLGMAALEVRANRPEHAELYYQKLLEANPRDPHAQAGLFALRAQMTDPVQAESRVKSLLAGDPDAHVLYFTLGNQYAQQSRWPEAQQAYFKAFSADPDNPDFAYNLAVSLDHVRQPKLALEYYRRAISLAQQRSSNFDQALARNRVQELAR